MPPRLASLLLLVALAAHAAEIKGKVINAVGGEALGRVAVVVLDGKLGTVTSNGGEFDIPNLPPGTYTLRLNAVGYRLLTIPFTLAGAADVKEFSITMVPDNFHRTDKVEVHGDIFQGADSAATVESNLTASEIRETSTVFADDPFRAVQTLPGVSAEGNNEFFAEFSVMGAPYSSVSTYIDDVLVLNPFHEIGSFAEGASLGVLTSEVVEEVKLMPAAYPEQFGDAAGAALDVRTREGSRGKPTFRISAGLAASEILGEGALGRARKGSWLVSARKSYINYLIQGRVQDAANVGFEDADLKLSYDLTPRQNVNFFATDGHTNMSNPPSGLTAGEYATGKSDFTLARAGWRWAESPRLLLDARAAYTREPDQLFDTSNLLVTSSDHREWVGGAGVSWAWARDEVLQAGWSERQLKDSQYQASFASDGTQLAPYAPAGSGLRQSGYVQQSSSLWQGKIHAVASLRWDSMSGFDVNPFSPQISVAMQATRSTQLQFGAGRYQQFSTSLEVNGPACTPFGFMPEKSEHYTAAIEQRLGENTRIRVQGFERENWSSMGVLKGSNGRAVATPCPSFESFPGSLYQRDYSRGVQLVIQRRSANRLSGWLGYTLARSRSQNDEVVYPLSETGAIILFPYNTPYAPTLEDQRHTLNAFAVYRWRPSINVSGKFLYGSGFPLSIGQFVQVGTGYQQVGTSTARFPYARLDLRLDKDWAFNRWKLTLYTEVLNVTNHYNRRYTYASGIDPNTGQAEVKTLQGLPVTPTAGVVFQF